jgi:hypothetical protein
VNRRPSGGIVRLADMGRGLLRLLLVVWIGLAITAIGVVAVSMVVFEILTLLLAVLCLPRE